MKQMKQLTIRFSVNEANKDIRLSFDGGREADLLMPSNIHASGVSTIDPPIRSASMRIEVITVYGQWNNGFIELKVWSNVVAF